MFTFCKNSQKGQDLVEYALMLAIILGIGWGIYSQTGEECVRKCIEPYGGSEEGQRAV